MKTSDGRCICIWAKTLWHIFLTLLALIAKKRIRDLRSDDDWRITVIKWSQGGVLFCSRRTSRINLGGIYAKCATESFAGCAKHLSHPDWDIPEASLLWWGREDGSNNETDTRLEERSSRSLWITTKEKTWSKEFKLEGHSWLSLKGTVSGILVCRIKHALVFPGSIHRKKRVSSSFDTDSLFLWNSSTFYKMILLEASDYKRKWCWNQVWWQLEIWLQKRCSQLFILSLCVMHTYISHEVMFMNVLREFSGHPNEEGRFFHWKLSYKSCLESPELESFCENL